MLWNAKLVSPMTRLIEAPKCGCFGSPFLALYLYFSFPKLNFDLLTTENSSRFGCYIFLVGEGRRLFLRPKGEICCPQGLAGRGRPEAGWFQLVWRIPPSALWKWRCTFWLTPTSPYNIRSHAIMEPNGKSSCWQSKYLKLKSARFFVTMNLLRNYM